MTEIAAAALAGQVVSHAGKAIAEEEKSTKKELLEQAKETPEFAEAARQLAKRIAIRQEIVTNCYKPIAKLFGVANHYFDNEFENDLAEKLAEVPEEHIVAPKASLAAPAMLQLGFSLDEPDLKEMYLNLLATASDDRKQNSAHPSFVEVIKQLSSSEIGFLQSVLNRKGRSTPIVRFKINTAGLEGFNTVASHVVEATPETSRAITENMVATYVDNWSRLGIVTVDYGNYLTDPEAYAWVETSGHMIGIKKHLEPTPEKSVEYDKGVLVVSDFGRAFARVVGANPNA